MQLYKSRNFGSFFQDTFTFLRQNGKHFYKHFFVINGIFIIILMIFAYFFSQFYSEILVGGIANNNHTFIEDYFNRNFGTVIIFGILFFIIGVVSAAIAYAFVPIYLKLYTIHGKSFSTREIIEEYKINFTKILVFVGASILLIIPIGLIAGLVSFVLAVTIIGLFLLPAVAGIVSLFYHSALMAYITDKDNIGRSFGYAWDLIGLKFWPSVASVGIFYLMSYITQNIITLIPYFIFIVDMIAGLDPEIGIIDYEAFQRKFFLVIMIMFMLSFLMSTVLNAIVQINQGIVFYSLKEDKENVSTKSNIDLIGTIE